jgi:hypothetical protein
VTRFVADVMAENRAMLGVFTGAGFDVVRELEHGEVEVTFPIAATDAFQERSRSATTSRSPPRCARSSSRRAWR